MSKSGVITRMEDALKKRLDDRRRKWLAALTRNQLNAMVDDAKRPWALTRDEVVQIILDTWDDQTTEDVVKHCRSAIE